MAGLTRREDGDATRREASPEGSSTRHETGDDRGGGSSLMRLPSALAGRYSIVQEIATRGAEADLLLVEDDAGGQWVAKIFRAGIEPKVEVFERVARAAPEHVIHLREHGRSDGRVWVVLEYAPLGNLSELIRCEGPRLDEQTVDEVLRELSGAIAHLHSLGIEHRDLKPDNVLVRTRNPLDLVLIDFGIASVVDASVHFTSGNRTIRYAPPEAQSGTLHKGRWDYWSLGMILVEALAGRQPFDGLSDQIVMSQLATRPVDDLVVGVAESRWRTLCRGLLRRDPKNRWGKAEIDLWLRGDKSLAVIEERAPANQPATGHKPYSFAGNTYANPAALAAGLAVNWPEAVKHLERGYIKNWVANEVGDQNLVSMLQDLDEQQGLDADTRLFRALLRLDPTLPPTFMGTVLNEDALRDWATQALKGAGLAIGVMAQLYSSRTLCFASDVSGNNNLAMIEGDWRQAISEYERLYQQVGSSSTGVSISPAAEPVLAQMLLACLPGSAEFAAQLRERASRAASQDARECEWFRDLGEPANAGPAALLLMLTLAHQAEEQTRNRRERAAEQGRREEYEKSLKTYGLIVGCTGGFAMGAVIGALSGVFPGYALLYLIQAGSSWKVANYVYVVWIVICGIIGIIAACIHFNLNKTAWFSKSSRDANRVKSEGLTIAGASLVATFLGFVGLGYLGFLPESFPKSFPEGVWEGTGTSKSGSRWTMRVTSNDSGVQIAYPSLNCGGHWEFERTSGVEYHFIERITYGRGCIRNGRVIISYGPNNNSMNYKYGTLASSASAVLRKTQEASAAEKGRINSMITKVVFAELIRDGRPVNQRATFPGPSSPVAVFVEYKGAHAGADSISVRLFNGDNKISACPDFMLNHQRGYYHCSWERIRAGQYQIKIFINDQFVYSKHLAIGP